MTFANVCSGTLLNLGTVCEDGAKCNNCIHGKNKLTPNKTAVSPLHFFSLRKRDTCGVGQYFENLFSCSGGEIESYPEAEERAPVSTTEDRQDAEEFEAFEEKPETTELQETRSKALENPTMGVIHRNASSPSLGFSSLPSGTRSTTGENPTVGVIRRNASTSSLEFSSLSSVRQSMLLSRKEEMLQQARR